MARSPSPFRDEEGDDGGIVREDSEEESEGEDLFGDNLERYGNVLYL